MTTGDNASAIDLIHELVATPSVSGQEAAAVGVFSRHAEALGFRAHIDAAGNAHACRGDEAAPCEIVLLGHIDTVPGDIPVRLEDGVLHGRGSVDAKGPLCAMLVGAQRCDLPDDVRLRVVAALGEETADSPGASFLRDSIDPPAACVIGEPSGWDGVTLGYKGRLLVEATHERALTHTAGPDGSAADALLDWWRGVLAIAGSHEAERVFDRVQASVRAMDAGDDGITDRARLDAGFRLPPALGPEALVGRIREITPDEVRLRFLGHTRAHATGRDDPVVRALSGAIREAGARPRPKLKTGTADLNVVGPVWGCPIAAYGPGDSALDHTPGEHLVLEEYLRAVGVLTHAIGALSAELVASGN